MKKTIKILSVLIIIVIAFSIGNICFARMAEYDDEESITLDSSIVETEKLVKSSEVEIKPNKPIIDFKLIMILNCHIRLKLSVFYIQYFEKMPITIEKGRSMPVWLPHEDINLW